MLMVTDPPYAVEYDPSWRNPAGAASTRRIGKMLNDDRADWREAWALFPGDVAYVWHGALHATIVAESLGPAASPSAARSSGQRNGWCSRAAIITGSASRLSMRVHFARNALAYVPRGQHAMVAAAIRQAFIQPDRRAPARPGVTSPTSSAAAGRSSAPSWTRAEEDVLAYMTFPSQHRVKLHSTNPLERLNKEVKRRADVVGIFPNEDSIVRLIGAVLLEANDEWQLQHRYMQIEGMVELDASAEANQSLIAEADAA